MSGNKPGGSGRRGSVRLAASSALFAAVIALACTDGGPAPARWDPPEPAPSVTAHAGFSHEPERERVVDPRSQPRLEFFDVVDDELDLEPTEYEVCPYRVRWRGFPAIREADGALLDAELYRSPNADDSDERVELRWFGADATRVETIYDRRVDRPRDGSPGPSCELAGERARTRVEQINAELAQGVWRPLARMDALFPAPGFPIAHAEGYGHEDEIIAGLAGVDRPVEVYYANGRLIAKVRQLKVLQDTPKPEWRRPDAEFCAKDPQIFAVDFDRASGLGLVRYNFSTGGCLCDDREIAARVELSPAWLTELEQRSTAALLAGRRERLAGETL